MKMFLICFHRAALHNDLNILHTFFVEMYKEKIIIPLMKMFLTCFHTRKLYNNLNILHKFIVEMYKEKLMNSAYENVLNTFS